MRLAKVVPLLFWGLALVLVLDSIYRGGASVSLIVVFPIIYGRSVEFLLGVAFLLAGFLAVPWLFSEEGREPLSEASPLDGGLHTEPPRARGGAGGLILVGPVPILFGSWQEVSPRVKWALVLVGALIVLLVASVILFG